MPVGQSVLGALVDTLVLAGLVALAGFIALVTALDGWTGTDAFGVLPVA